MRSKEVDGAIKQLKSNANYCVTSIETTKTILSYIETLEQLPNKIRDKIKELEEKYVELSKNKSSSEKAELNHEYIEKRSLLESLLGE